MAGKKRPTRHLTNARKKRLRKLIIADSSMRTRDGNIVPVSKLTHAQIGKIIGLHPNTVWRVFKAAKVIRLRSKKELRKKVKDLVRRNAFITAKDGRKIRIRELLQIEIADIVGLHSTVISDIFLELGFRRRSTPRPHFSKKQRIRLAQEGLTKDFLLLDRAQQAKLIGEIAILETSGLKLKVGAARKTLRILEAAIRQHELILNSQKGLVTAAKAAIEKAEKAHRPKKQIVEIGEQVSKDYKTERNFLKALRALAIDLRAELELRRKK